MRYDYTKLSEMMREYGDAFYLLDTAQFIKNFHELHDAFARRYENFSIAYSYKTNYIPKLCKTVEKLGGYAEVVSDMEAEIALRVGVSPTHIIWNGPYKRLQKVEEFLLAGGTVHIDSVYEWDAIVAMAKRYPNKELRVGLRCNFDIGDEVISRFGFDTQSETFEKVWNELRLHENIHCVGLQCHFASRNLRTWKPRVEKMLQLIDRLQFVPDYIDLGGGLFGKMHPSLQAQFDTAIPDYDAYADIVASAFAERFADTDKKPLLLIEPGSALVGDCMKFVAKVVNIKNVRGKSIATLPGSIYNINPTLNKKNPPLEVFTETKSKRDFYEDLDFGGFTCIESDYLYRHYSGQLAVGDIVVFGNVGSYSVVLKPPFILPNFPVLDICGNTTEVVKKGECFEDVFRTYVF